MTISRISRTIVQGKGKRVDPKPDRARLAQAASKSVYAGSDYHCPGVGGRPLKYRAKPASICPRHWSEAEATAALRVAMTQGTVSEVWEDGFPRYVWHKDGDVWYEARHTRGPYGTFHAYPIELGQLPGGLAS
jgi:hypothetical protein